MSSCMLNSNAGVKSIAKNLRASRAYDSTLMRFTLNMLAYDNEVEDHVISLSNDIWHVLEHKQWKVIYNESFTYHEFYSYEDGFTFRFGKNAEDDPKWCPLGNTIADIECISGKCPKINGHNCRFCYKSNGGDVAHCMTCADASKLLDKINENHQLQQVAWGITGYYTNPEFSDILSMCKAKHITPNYTTNGVDIDDAAVEHTLDTCGRVAVSCYEGAKDLCYATIKKFGDAAVKRGKKFPCNIHVVISKETFKHVMSVLQDAKDKKIENLGAIVMLRMKNVGRATSLDPHIPDEMYEQAVKFCLENDIKFGFDSCGCHRVEDVLEKMGRLDLVPAIEPCESSRFSGYWNVKGQYYNCSFCEQLPEHYPVDMSKFKIFTEFWNSAELAKLRFPKDGWKCKSCPFMLLDK